MMKRCRRNSNYNKAKLTLISRLNDLIQVITDVEKTDILPTVGDNYAVSVRLKDNSMYAYAPRMFAHSERLELRQITDDLLARGIIKPSVSPYCARVVPIKKKDDRMRLRVDLRPLNGRIFKEISVSDY